MYSPAQASTGVFIPVSNHPDPSDNAKTRLQQSEISDRETALQSKTMGGSNSSTRSEIPPSSCVHSLLAEIISEAFTCFNAIGLGVGDSVRFLKKTAP